MVNYIGFIKSNYTSSWSCRSMSKYRSSVSSKRWERTQRRKRSRKGVTAESCEEGVLEAFCPFSNAGTAGTVLGPS